MTNHIHFKSWVEWVTFDESTDKFQVTVRDLGNEVKRKFVEDFDYVIDASGHYTQPNYVSYPGEETFPGTVMHAKFFIDASRYAGKRILLVGSSFSAEDLAIKSIVAGADKVTICYRSQPTNLVFPMGIDEKPLLTKIEGSTVRFRDGSWADYDVIIYCTGYLYDYPYMERSLRLNISEKRHMPLYKQVVHPKNTRLMYVGVQNLAYTFPLFWLQGHLCAQAISGEVKLPSVETMMEYIRVNEEKRGSLKSILEAIEFQTGYLNELSHQLGKPSVDGMHFVRQWLKDRYEDIGHYKRKSHYQSKYR